MFSRLPKRRSVSYDYAMSENYFKLIIKNVPTQDEDWLTSLCFDYDAQGVSENLEFKQEIFEFEPQTVQTPTHNLEVYFLTTPAAELLQELKLRLPQSEVVMSEEQVKDWLEEWKKGFEAFELAHGLWIVPSWKPVPKQAKSFLRLDPGMAFGSGTHETTQLASQLTIEFADAQKLPFTAIDVGCGTGILSMVAALNEADVDAIDIEKEALRVTQENIELNELEDFVHVKHQSLEGITGQYDLVIANIIDAVLIKIKDDLIRVAKKTIIVSGILQDHAEEFEQDFSKTLKLVNTVKKGEWQAYIWEKP